ncbi:MAG: tetratricopeptide repeat protein [Bacteroidota bacterium]
MNKQEFISLVEQPEQLGKSHITALRQVASDFPYFQAAQVLLTKALYNDHHYEFEKQLKHTSLLVPDRTVLFRYIHNLSDQQQRTEIVIPEIVEAAKEETQVSILPNSPIEIPVDSAIEEPDEEVSAVPAEIVLESTQEEPQGKDEPVVTVTTTHEPIITDSVKVEPEIEKEAVQEIRSSESHSFTEWLQLQQDKKLEVAEAPAAKLLSEPVEEVSTQPIVPPTEVTDRTLMEAEIAEQVKRSNVNDFESILDKFIRENPRISRGKAEFYNPVNMAKQSVEENDEIVTETLANVYYKQGHYKKAIRAYEKLCLIYPHKMTYFASLIQKIKTETKE